MSCRLRSDMNLTEAAPTMWHRNTGFQGLCFPTCRIDRGGWLRSLLDQVSRDSRTCYSCSRTAVSQILCRPRHPHGPTPEMFIFPLSWTNFLLLDNASYTLIFPPHLQSSIKMNPFSFSGWQLANECGMHVHLVQSSYETACCLLQGPGTM